MEPILFKHGKDARHQPEGRRRHLQLIQEQSFKTFHIIERDRAPTLSSQRLGTSELRKSRVDRLGSRKDGIIRNRERTSLCREHPRQGLGAASQRLCSRSHLLLYLRHARVQTEALRRGRSLWLTKPALKLATGSFRVKQRSRSRANFVNKFSQPD